ncbi:hypothetical protein ABPG72_015391 [Tetrahymena utriculariae]
MAQLLSSIFLKNYKKPIYRLKCKYSLIDLNKGKTEILKIEKQNKKTGDIKQLLSNSESSENNQEEDVKIVMFSGNPGYIRFYDRFLHELSKQLENKFDIYGIGHLGQFNYQNKPIHNDFSLTDQIDQKVEFMNYLFKKYPKSRFILISHSIGSYAVLNMLDRIPSEKIVFSYKLYPVIERIKETPNGIHKAKLPYFPYIYLSSFAVGFFSYLPMSLKRVISKMYLESELDNVKEDVSDMAEIFATYATYSNFYSMLYMTRTEYQMLNERQAKLLDKFSQKMMLYYGIDDAWCPVQYYKDIRIDMPHLNANLDEKGFLHAFVIGGSTLKSELISGWIKQKLDEIDYEY